MEITLTPEQEKLFRSIGAKLNGAMGGKAKGRNKAKACRANGKLGGRPKRTASAAA